MKSSLSSSHNELGVSSAIDNKAGPSLFNHIFIMTLGFVVCGIFYWLGFSFGQNANKAEIILYIGNLFHRELAFEYSRRRGITANYF